MAVIFRALRHLLPTGRAWRITVDKRLRRYMEGLAAAMSRIRDDVDDVWLDVFPQTTRRLDEWEDQFGLRTAGLSEQQRRDRLEGAWKALGGQSPRYIEDTLRGAGFDVYVHEWWVPGTEAPIGVHAAAEPRDPFLWLAQEYTGVVLYVAECGESAGACGEPAAECGNTVERIGYPLVNKVTKAELGLSAECGEASAACGEPLAECGNYNGYRETILSYPLPTDPATWPYFLYIGGPEFGDTATVPAARRDEFERLCLKICPAHLWLGILVQY